MLLQHRGMPNFSPFPRHMLGLGYCAERDPNGECSHLGLGKHRHLFAASSRPAFNANPRSPLIDRNVRFAADGVAVDHFGNAAPTEGQQQGGVGAIESGPYAGGSKGAGSRFDYWQPPDGGLEAAIGDDMPTWLQTLVQGRPLQRR